MMLLNAGATKELVLCVVCVQSRDLLATRCHCVLFSKESRRFQGLACALVRGRILPTSCLVFDPFLLKNIF